MKLTDSDQLALEVARIAELKRSFKFDYETTNGGAAGYQSLRESVHLLDLFYKPAFESHRPIIGPVIAKTKQAIIRVLNKLLSISLARQVEYNQRVWNQLCHIALLEQRVEKLERLLQKEK